MKSFIDSVQEYIARNFDDLQKVEIIVPNNRTGSALLSSLKKNMTEVCWAPKITPIKEIFARNAKIHEAENIVMVYTLYKVFANHINESEGDTSFDNFYNFGEVLLSDFDDIDKYLVDPQKLFSNIADEKEIDVKFADIENELIEILRTFWQNVSANSIADNKLKSLELWQKMPGTSGFSSLKRSMCSVVNSLHARRKSGFRSPRISARLSSHSWLKRTSTVSKTAIFSSTIT